MGIATNTAAPKVDLTRRLVGHLKDLMRRGVLHPGARLPPERELCVAFGVSRATLRHALKALEVMGVVRQRVGDGTYLVETGEEVFREPLELLLLIDNVSLEDVLETRLIVEPELAARAAERADSADLARMRASLEAMQKWKRKDKLIGADLAFHRAVFLAARNPICARLFTLLHEFMHASVDLTSRLVDWEHTLKFHRAIYSAIERRRPVEARERMIEHLRDARSLLARARAQAKPVDLTARDLQAVRVLPQ